MQQFFPFPCGNIGFNFATLYYLGYNDYKRKQQVQQDSPRECIITLKAIASKQILFSRKALS